MTLKRILGLSLVAVLLAHLVSPELQAQTGANLMRLADGIGNRISSTSEGIYRSLAVVLIDPVTNAPVVYATDSRAAGVSDSNTIRTVEATDSQMSAGIGATGDSAATQGSTGSINSKLRLITSQLDTMSTALALIDDDQTGATPAAIVSAATTNATNVKASAGRLMGLALFNSTTTPYYFRVYNLASAPTCSSATGWVFSAAVPPASAAGQIGGFTLPIPPAGIALGTGFGYCITLNAASTDNNAAAVGVTGVAIYK